MAGVTVPSISAVATKVFRMNSSLRTECYQAETLLSFELRSRPTSPQSNRDARGRGKLSRNRRSRPVPDLQHVTRGAFRIGHCLGVECGIPNILLRQAERDSLPAAADSSGACVAGSPRDMSSPLDFAHSTGKTHEKHECQPKP